MTDFSERFIGSNPAENKILTFQAVQIFLYLSLNANQGSIPCDILPSSH